MNIRNELVSVFDPEISFDANLQTLRSLKQRGYRADEVQATLESMFQETSDERAQATIADLLDCVVGWCAPHYAVWTD
jgi:hypothetical protein